MSRLLDNRKSLHHQVVDAHQQYRQLLSQLEGIQPLANFGMAWAMTAHELNNLLTPIINYAQYALLYPEDSELTKKALQKVLSLSQRSSRMIEKVLVLAGTVPMEKSECLFAELLDEVLEGLGRDFSKDSIRIVRDFEPELKVWAEPDAMRQVLMNLILNAYRAMKDSGGILTFSASENSETTSVELSDTGPGIDPDRLHSIFDAFYTFGTHNGKGLGLAYCRKVVESHGGCISADSCPGHGTHFKILLPKCNT